MNEYQEKNECKGNSKSGGRGKARTGNGKRSKGKGKDFKDRRDSRDSGRSANVNYYESPTNDWRWYALTPQLVKDTASFPYGYATGSRVNLGQFGDNLNTNAIPGIMKLKYVPTVGWSDSDVSPVNTAARNLMSFIRQSNSGAKNYDSPDLIMYLLAMDSALSYLAYCKRVYGIAMLSSVVNRYYPKALIESMKISYEDVMTNLPSLRAFINTFAVKLSAMAVPGNLAYNAKHMWMCSGLYTDADDQKAQTYYFEPEGFHIYTRDPDGASFLDFTYQFNDITGPLATVQDIRDFGKRILDPILYGYGEEDFNIISGDILKAYGTNIYRASGIEETYTVIPMRDEVVLSQIENATLYGLGVNSSTDSSFQWINPATGKWEATTAYTMYSIYQSPDKSHVVSKPGRMYVHQTKPLNMTARDRILNAHTVEPTPEWSLEASRLTNIPNVWKEVMYTGSDPGTEAPFRFVGIDPIEDSGETGTYPVDALTYVTASSEILTRGFMYNYAYPTGGTVGTLHESDEVQSNITVTVPASKSGSTYNVSKTADDVVQGFMTQLNTMAEITNFDWHPMVTFTGAVVNNVTNGLYTALGSTGPDFIFGDINNYTIINQANLMQMSEMALMNLFGMLTYGK